MATQEDLASLNKLVVAGSPEEVVPSIQTKTWLSWPEG